MRSVKFHFCSFLSRKWRCTLYLTLYKDVYQLFVRHTHIVSLETKASVTIIALNEGKCHYFYKIGNFFLFNLESFWQFFKQNNSKSSQGKSKFLLLSYREYLALGTLFSFFSPNLKFFKLWKKKSQNLDFFKKNTFLHFFCQKFKKYEIRLKTKNLFLDMGL